MVSVHARFGRSVRLVAVVIAAGLVLGGCASRRAASNGEPSTTGSIPRSGAEGAGAVEQWQKRYQANDADREAVIGYAQALRANGQVEQAVAVLERGVLKFPKDAAVASAYGKVLAVAGRFDEALKVVRSANDPVRPDWRLFSAEGAIQDQLANPTEARRLYGEALKLAPEDPTILNNLGLSYVLTNELPAAEKVLRRAAQNPQADVRVRQNLSLALGLQGKFSEAETVATAALPPDQAAANMAYLRTMMSQPNTWQKIKATDKPKA